MKIKRYLVRDMPEALARIREDLGPEAIIVSSRQVHGRGWRRFLAAPLLEVTAAVDEAQVAGRVESDAGREGDLRQEVAEVKRLLQRVLDRPPAAYPGGPLAYWRNFLLELEIGPVLAEKLTEDLPVEKGEDGEDGTAAVLAERISSLLSSLPQAPPGRIYALIGPTGVGKTTTAAKLAARYALFQKKRVALITADTYRIGAVEQLKIYGEILGLPVEVVLTPGELKSAVTRHADKDVILIDTAGRPTHNAMYISELKGLLRVVQPLETVLVLSVTTRGRDLLRQVEDYRPLKYNRLIFTKLDETRTLGCILNVAWSANVPVIYLTNGQNVPDDISAAEPRQLAKMILGG